MKHLFLFLLFFSNPNFAQDKENYYSSIITHINNYELDKASSEIRSLDNLNSRILFQNEVNYLKTGTISADILSLDINQFSYYLKGIYYNYVGDYYRRVSGKFSKKSYQLYLQSYQLAQHYNNKSLQQESLRKMLNLFLVNEMNFIQFSNYSFKYSQLNNDYINTFWAAYYAIFKLYYEKTEYKKQNNFNIKNFESLVKYANKPILKGKVYQIIGVYYSVVGNHTFSQKNIENAKIEFKKSNEFYSQLALMQVEFNEGYDYLETENLKKAINIFRKSDQSTYFKKDIKSKFLIEDALYKAYSKAKNKDSAIYYLNRKTAYADTLKREEDAIAIHEIDINYGVREKDRQILYLKEKFSQNKTLYLSLIFGVFLLALYSFIRWKKEDKLRKNALLEAHYIKTEYHEAVEELKKIKQLVIQDHIILKNKAKVNLDDLLYIKADDHYLQLVTNKKNEFVREKLTEILNQLPPNFIKCHRSFIVNKNHIKRVEKLFVIMNDNTEIPISRGFKITL